MVLPCPGSRAWSAPRPAAISAAENSTHKLSLPWVEINSVKRLRGVFGAWDTTASGELARRAKEAGKDGEPFRSAEVTASAVIVFDSRCCTRDLGRRPSGVGPRGIVDCKAAAGTAAEAIDF